MPTLTDIRDALGFTADEVLAATGWPRERLVAIERVDDLDETAERTLGDLYGVHIGEALASESPRVPPIAALLKGEALHLSAPARFSMAETVGVARTIRALQARMGVSGGWAALTRFPDDNDYTHPRHGWPEKLGDRVRRRLTLARGPVVSVQDQLLDPLDVLVLVEDLPDAVDAFSLATPETGGVIVLNRASQHYGSAFGRRITLTHELCHLLFDRAKMQRMKRFCAIAYGEVQRKPARDQEDEIERRARAFAVWLLAPRRLLDSVLASAAESSYAVVGGPLLEETRVREVMETFGMGYYAARSHLQNAGQLSLRDEIPRVDPSSPDLWERRDPAPVLDPNALAAGVSPLRAGVLLDWLLQAHKVGAVSESYVRESLRLSWGAWQSLRGPLGLPSGGTWTAASATADASA